MARLFYARWQCVVATILLLAQLWPGGNRVSAVKQQDFKTCPQSGFCRRHRAFREARYRCFNNASFKESFAAASAAIAGPAVAVAVGLPSARLPAMEDTVSADPTSVIHDAANGRFVARLVLPSPRLAGADDEVNPLYLVIDTLASEAVRVRVGPKAPGFEPVSHPGIAALLDVEGNDGTTGAPKRAAYAVRLEGVPPGAFHMDVLAGASAEKDNNGHHGTSVRVHSHPLQIDVFRRGQVVASINQQQLFRYETGGTGPIASSTSQDEALNKSSKDKTNEDKNETKMTEDNNEKNNEAESWNQAASRIAVDGAFSETFRGFTDSKPNGPRSVGFDVFFHDSKLAYGLAEHATRLNLPSTFGPGARYSEPYRLYNLDVFEYINDSPMALYGHVPLLMSHRAHTAVGALILTAAETWVDVARESKGVRSHWMFETGPLDMFVFAGDTPTQVHLQYVGLTGNQYLPPMHAIGYHQSRWNYKSVEDVLDVDEKFDEFDIPLDTIWLDIEHTKERRYFTWDTASFSKPGRMAQRLGSKGRNLVLISDPHIKVDSNYHVYSGAKALNIYVQDAAGTAAFQGHCWPGQSSWLDYMLPEASKYWSSLYAMNMFEGNAHNVFVWNDMNEPSVFSGPEITMPKDVKHLRGQHEHRQVHNIYGMLQQNATHQGLLARDKVLDARSFVLSRAFFAGTQRYGAVWTGDNTATWEQLAGTTSMILGLSTCGIGFAGADVGGFFGNPTPELLVRWYQLAALQPFFRAHAHIETARREPWLLRDPEHVGAVREAVRFRYRLLPMIYTAFAKAALQGEPVLRPLMFEYELSDDLIDNDVSVENGIDSVWMIGRSGLLVAPVVAQGKEQRSVLLPRIRHTDARNQGWTSGVPDIWFQHAMRINDFFEGEGAGKEYKGKDEAQTIGPVPIGKLLVLQRGGSIVFRREVVRRSVGVALALPRPDPLSLVIALDQEGQATGELYLDDGRTHEYKREKSGHAWIQVSVDKQGTLKGTCAQCSKTERKPWHAEIERAIILVPQEAAQKGFRINPKLTIARRLTNQKGGSHAYEVKLTGSKVHTGDPEWALQLFGMDSTNENSDL